MTIIKLNKKTKYPVFLVTMIGTVIFGAAAVVFQYNGLANARSAIRAFQSQIDKEEKTNTELTNDLFLVTDPASLDVAAKAGNLILEKKPEYLEVSYSVPSY